MIDDPIPLNEVSYSLYEIDEALYKPPCNFPFSPLIYYCFIGVFGTWVSALPPKGLASK